MPRGKASYNAPLTFAEVVATGKLEATGDFPSSLRPTLISLYCDAKGNQCNDGAPSLWPLRAEQFADDVMAKARFVFGELQHRGFAIEKSNAVAEHRNLAKRLKAAINKVSKYPDRTQAEGFDDFPYHLRHISRDLDSLLGVDTDPRGCADLLDAFHAEKTTVDAVVAALKRLAADIEAAGKAVKAMSPKPHKRNFRRKSAEWLAESVVLVLKQYGLSASGYASLDHGGSSVAVEIMKVVGDAVGLQFTKRTWGEIIPQIR
jgi:hypothetical protein